MLFRPAPGPVDFPTSGPKEESLALEGEGFGGEEGRLIPSHLVSVAIFQNPIQGLHRDIKCEAEIGTADQHYNLFPE